ncbi:tetratricopeptide repeat-containing sensor histidine kinase [Mucilaginibacter sp. E4BP6]|uniref:tetratricopeptide repeat-containing sensor histidine kinase n=1 Tax=Mucilaginibacter sp. E4BP6 TaxID=2723089 RepID=UPI0015CEC40F|nr:ATP-binding protein [Mucilaginibacter sp. E4BP6]NYE64886.1 signal transduction histidine kinase [Mucilaginibacter sp. E4BP6]
MARTLNKLSLIWILLSLALTACHKTAPTTATGQWADYRKAYNFLNKNKDSAFYYFNRSATNSSDKAQVALAYQNMALIQSDAGDNYGAQESLTLALKSLDENDPKNRGHLAEDYNQMAITFSNLSDNAQAITYYGLALQYADDPQLKSYFLNNQGNAYKDMKAYTKALSSYNAVISIVGRKGIAYARVLTNLAITKWLQNPRYNAAPELLRSLSIRLQEKDVWGENSSYAHLSEFYIDRQPDSALWYAQKMFNTARRLKSPDDELYALRKLILLVPKQAKLFFQRYQHLEDSLQTRRAAAKNQFAVIRYNVAQSKAENLQLQKKNEERRYQLITVSAVSSLALIWTIWWYRKRKQRLQLETENKIRESKLQLSQKVHDQVANGVYRIMSEVEHNSDFDKSHLLDQLDSVYEMSRNIAHDETGSDGDFTERVSTLLNAFKKTAIRLAVSGNEPGLWQPVSAFAREQLELVLQELMVNMSKHSRATQAYIEFTLEEDSLKIDYRDNGIGMSNQGKKGKGLQNTVSRIKALNGSIKFENQNEKGLHIEIQVPIEK